jgi:DNA-binding NarL/FixJ family response regulator
VRIIVADDQPDVRSALKLALEEKPGTRVVDEVSTPAELVQQVWINSPDLVLLDWELPGIKPKELLQTLHTFCPHLSVIALSSRPQVKKAAIAAGAQEFVCKSEPSEFLIAALDRFYIRVNPKGCPPTVEKDSTGNKSHS